MARSSRSGEPRARVVGGIAVREAVGHDQVDHVVGREPLEAALARKRREQLERDGRAPGRGHDLERPPTRSRLRLDLDVDEQVRAGGFTRIRPIESPEPAAASTRAPASSRPRSISRTGFSECPGHQLGGSTLRTAGGDGRGTACALAAEAIRGSATSDQPRERRRSVAHGDGSSLLGLGLRNPQREGRREQQRDAAEQQRPRGIVAEPV